MDVDTAGLDGPTLSAWIYDSSRGAAAGKLRLDRLNRRGAVTVVDAATVTWVRGAHRPRIGPPHATRTPATGRLSAVELLLWHLIVPPARPAGGAAQLAQALSGTGVTKEFLDELRAGLAPDTSALVVLARAAGLEEVQSVIERGRARGDVRLLLAPLSADGLAVLEAFAQTDAAASW